MTPLLASSTGDFNDALDFIVHKRESVSGGVQVGGSELLGFAGTHLLVSGVAVLVACAISVPIGLCLGHVGKGEFVAITISNVGRAMPTLALLAFFVAYLGVGFTNVTFVLVLLAIPPILTNVYVGIRQVDRDTVDAARGMGLTELQIIRRVELPLALPIIFGGIRTSSVNVVATATIAPLASVNTLGTPIINANVYGGPGRLGAAILVALLTLAIDIALLAVQKAVTPAGLKLARGEEQQRRRLPAPTIPTEGTTDMTRSIRGALALVATLVLAIAVAACGSSSSSSSNTSSSSGSSSSKGTLITKNSANAGKSISVGSKNFTEQFILGNIYADALKAAGYNVKKKLNLGSEVVAFKALKQGDVEAYPEYTGTALTSFYGVKVTAVPKTPGAAFTELKPKLAKDKITALPRGPVRQHVPPGHDEGDREEAREPDADLAAQGQVAEAPRSTASRSAGSGPTACWACRRPTGSSSRSSSPTRIQVLRCSTRAQADVAFVFTTDATLATGKYAILDDDKNLFPPYHITYMFRDDALKKLGPDVKKTVVKIELPLTNKVMGELNSRVVLDKQKPSDVAHAYLKAYHFVK